MWKICFAEIDVLDSHDFRGGPLNISPLAEDAAILEKVVKLGFWRISL